VCWRPEAKLELADGGTGVRSVTHSSSGLSALSMRRIYASENATRVCALRNFRRVQMPDGVGRPAGEGGGNHAKRDKVARPAMHAALLSANGRELGHRTIRPKDYIGPQRKPAAKPLHHRRRGAQGTAFITLDVLIQRRLQQPTAFRQVVQRCAQFFSLLATHRARSSRHCACGSRGFTPRDLRALIARDIARTRQ
jgi:hypothetical protein